MIFLRAILVFDRHDLTVNARRRRVDGGVGHSAARTIPRPKTLANPAQGFGKDRHMTAFWLPSGCGMAPTAMKSPTLMSSIFACSAPNICRVVGDFHRRVCAVLLLEDKRRSTHAAYSTTDAYGLRLL